MPMTAPPPASSALSVTICRMRRPRVAPMADRTASSRARSVARANCMFITFTHAMTSTPTQKASIVHIVPRSCVPVNWSMSGSTWALLNALFVSAYALANRPANPSNSACAWSKGTPRFRRPTTEGLVAWGSLRGRTGNSL